MYSGPRACVCLCASVCGCVCVAAPSAVLTAPPPPQVSVLVLFALAFLTCVVFLVVYKVYKYDRACPDGFVLKVSPPIPWAPDAFAPCPPA